MIRVITFLLLSLGLVADAPPKKDLPSLLPEGVWTPLLDGKYKGMGDSIWVYEFNPRTSLVTMRNPYGEDDYSFTEEEFTVSIYYEDATCAYSKKMIGSVLHLIYKPFSSGGKTSLCSYSYQLVK